MRFEAAATLLGVLLCTPLPAQEKAPESEQPRPTNRDRSDVAFLHDGGGFPMNLEPKAVPAAKAPIGDGDMVMGIVIEGEARAYPVNYMNGPLNEIVNDELGGQAIASTW